MPRYLWWGIFTAKHSTWDWQELSDWQRLSSHSYLPSPSHRFLTLGHILYFQDVFLIGIEWVISWGVGMNPSEKTDIRIWWKWSWSLALKDGWEFEDKKTRKQMFWAQSHTWKNGTGKRQDVGHGRGLTLDFKVGLVWKGKQKCTGSSINSHSHCRCPIYTCLLVCALQ